MTIKIFIPELKIHPTGSGDVYGWYNPSLELVLVVRFARRQAGKIDAESCGLAEDAQLIGHFNERDCNQELKDPSQPFFEFKFTRTSIDVATMTGNLSYDLYTYPLPSLLSTTKNKQKFLSTSPLELDLTQLNSHWTSTQKHVKTSASEVSRNLMMLEITGRHVLEQSRPSGQVLDAVVSQINSLSTPTEGTSSLFSRYPTCPHLISNTFSVVSTIISLFLSILNVSFVVPRTSLKDFSACLHQLDVRLRQSMTAPMQLHTIYFDPYIGDNPRRALYINFYNTIWLVANDVIVGHALSAYLCENHENLSHSLHVGLKKYTIHVVRESLGWLNEWPAGLKLNYELGRFVGQGFLWVTELWEEILLIRMCSYLSSIVYIVGLSSTSGVTMALSLFSDLLSLFTIHLYFFYYIATTVFSWHLKVMYALFNVFRGKKFNIIRKRVEPADYNIDELLLGTVLFTLATFLFPTVLAYYLVFAVSRMTIIGLHALTETILAFMNHFPLFAITLRFKDPNRLPGGIHMTYKTKMKCWQLQNRPIGFSSIFFQHLRLWKRLAAHYSPLYLLNQLITGRFISPISRTRLQYPAVPDL